MKTIITGSRNRITEQDVLEAIEQSGFKDEITEVVSGCAQGVDKMGEAWAVRQGVPIKRFPYPSHLKKRGGPVRNRQMAEYADALIAVWDGESRGTANMVEEALKLHLRVSVYGAAKGHRGSV